MASQVSIKRISFCLLLSLSFLGVSGFAQSKSDPPPQKAETLNDENAVYAEPNFDAKVIAVLPGGKTYSISNGIFAGAFYRIRVKPGLVGYIADSDVRPFGQKLKDKKAPSKEKKRAEPKRRPFEFSRYMGPSFYQIKFEEDTMGSSRSEPVNFFGLKMSGADVLLEGLLPTEINILYAPKPPGYYETLTRHSASGFIFMTDLLLQNYLPQSKDSLIFFGFGPLFRYSKFDVTLTESGANKNYSLEDMTLGAAFNAGLALRVSSVALRLEAKYHWEKRSYLGFGAALQFLF